VEWYKESIAENKNVEMVFYPRDRSEDALTAWASDVGMPWPTVKFSKLEKVKDVSKHAGNAVPNYVMVDADGEVIAKGRGQIQQKIKELEPGP